MDYRGNYVPKKQRKLGYRIVVPFSLLIIAIGLMVYSSFNNKEGIIDQSLTICKMSNKETRTLINSLEKKREEAGIANITFADYGQYGETLGLYKNPYEVNVRDPFNGKTVFLNNVCSGEESTYLMGVELDSKIPLEFLDDGFYEVELLNGLERTRLISETLIDDVVHTISRNGITKRIRILANKELFDFEDTKVLNDNVLYFEVSTDDSEINKFDIVLDPSGLTKYQDGTTNYGHAYKGLIEAEEMYDVAIEVKKILEEQGLKVLVSRDNVSAINAFGEGGRVYNGYEVEAKYYLQLNLMYSGHPNDVGATMLYSNFSSNRFASAMMKSLTDSTSLKPSNFSSKNNIDGVYQTRKVDNMDYMNIIRETGGKFTAAGVKDDFAVLNAFARDIRKGMQVVVVEYGYMNDEATFNTWKNEKDAIIQATANGILVGLGIK